MTHSRIREGDLIDRYLLGQLPEKEQAEFEEHYLSCRQCAEEMEQAGELIASVKAGVPETRPARPRPKVFLLPTPVWGLAAALAVVAVYLSVRPPAAPPAPVVRQPRAEAGESLPVVELTSYRAGVETGGRLRATEKAFRLRLDLRGLASAPERTVDVVAESGERVWSGSGLAGAGDWLEARVEGVRFEPGQHWVRLSAGGGFEREYSLVVEP